MLILNVFFTALFSLAAGQTAYLNVLAVPAPSLALKTPPPAVCDITLSFFDGQANELKSKEVKINPGTSASLPLRTFGDFWPGKGRSTVYGEVQLMADSDPSCRLINSLEITNADGGTEVLTPLFGGAFAATF